ncbi:restriction endonuclease [Anaerorhabdus furcosa]|uniref:Restriction system protein n=1 Tax=Anaerorhabdus furcosa TaxID=118967 RepID=A0A1T4L6K9_9FIRM|nr:restriction endonuclease [Anaerorhabdus furcosa]SJZ50335.1 restriction system protein [Anaerorhabdus furcosa]
MIPKYNEMYNELLTVLSEGSDFKFKDLVEKISDDLQLTEDERNELMGNKKSSVIYYRLAWTKTYLVKAGLVESVKRGVYKITKEGKRVINLDKKIDNQFLMNYPSFVDFFRPANLGDLSNIEKIEEINNTNTPDESIESAIRIINARLSSELLEIIFSKNPRFFESLVLDLLDKMGYAFNKESIKSTSYTNDEGIDGIIEEDRFGFNSIYTQAKRWTGVVGRPEIQKFLGAVAGQGGTKGLFITTSRFSEDAIAFAEKQLQVKLVLVDGEKLTELMIKYGLGVSVIKTYELKQIDNDYFEEEI